MDMFAQVNDFVANHDAHESYTVEYLCNTAQEDIAILTQQTYI